MKSEIVALLRCPYCRRPLEEREVLQRSGEDVLFGVLRCDCSEFPIVDGIPSLLLLPHLRAVLEALREGDTKRARALSLSPNGQKILAASHDMGASRTGGQFLQALMGLAAAGVSNFESARFGRPVSFWETLGDRPFQTYLKHRFSAESLWAVYALLPLLKARNETVLDLGCGVGHNSFILSKYARPRQLISADVAFWRLFLARKYMAPDAAFLQIDANFPLPFRDGALDCVLSVDVLHYINAQATLARELERILAPSGVLLLMHLHNALRENIGAGRPRRPASWLDLFHQVPFVASAEQTLVEAFLRGEPLDLSSGDPPRVLDGANAICLLGTKDAALLAARFPSAFEFMDTRDNLHVNPIYRREQSGDSERLVRKFPSEQFRRDYPLSERYLPESVPLGPSGSDDLIGRLTLREPERIRELMRKFVLLDLPKKYV